MPEPERHEFADREESAQLMRQMHGLAVTSPQYVALYYLCACKFLTALSSLPVPMPTYTAPLTHLRQPAPTQSTVAHVTGAMPGKCAFCTQYGHHIRSCPLVWEYVGRGLAVYHDGRVRLPNYTRVPNDGTGRGIKASIDAWHAARGRAAAASGARGGSGALTPVVLQDRGRLLEEPPRDAHHARAAPAAGTGSGTHFMGFFEVTDSS